MVVTNTISGNKPVYFDSNGESQEEENGKACSNFREITFLCPTDNGENSTAWIYFPMGILILCFILPDISKALRSFSKRCAASFWAAIIILESVMGIIAAIIIAGDVGASYGAGFIEYIMAAVGVIFIHDLDEKIFEGT
eukprot:858098_1